MPGRRRGRSDSLISIAAGLRAAKGFIGSMGLRDMRQTGSSIRDYSPLLFTLENRSRQRRNALRKGYSLPQIKFHEEGETFGFGTAEWARSPFVIAGRSPRTTHDLPYPAMPLGTKRNRSIQYCDMCCAFRISCMGPAIRRRATAAIAAGRYRGNEDALSCHPKGTPYVRPPTGLQVRCRRSTPFALCLRRGGPLGLLRVVAALSLPSGAHVLYVGGHGGAYHRGEASM